MSLVFAIIALGKLPGAKSWRAREGNYWSAYAEKEHKRAMAEFTWKQFKKKLLNEPVDIKIHQARLIDEYPDIYPNCRHTGGIIELTLQIENVPNYLPKYESSTKWFDNEGLFNERNRNVLEAINHDGSWDFHDIYPHPVYSARSQNGRLVLTKPFCQDGATAEEYPEAIIPIFEISPATLEISPRHVKNYKERVYFFKKPVSFELIHAVEGLKPQQKVLTPEKDKEALESLSKLKKNSAAPRTFDNAGYNRVTTEPKN